MSIQASCTGCGLILEVPEMGLTMRGDITLQIKPCQTCLDAAEIHALEDANNQEEISRDPALFHPDGSPKSVEEACEGQEGGD